MALNPPMLHARMPMGIAGEMWLLTRNGVGIEFQRGAQTVKGKGIVYLTSVRVCFVFDAPVGDVIAFDSPMQGIIGDPEFKQPIFGANRLEGRVAPVPGKGLDMSSHVDWKITFYNAGSGTFLRVFYTLLEKYRLGDVRARQAAFAPQQMQVYLNSLVGLQDPNDPSVLYLSQPEPAQAGSQQWPGYSPPPAPAAHYQQQQQQQPSPFDPPQKPQATMAAAPAVNPAYLAAMGGGASPAPAQGQGQGQAAAQYAQYQAQQPQAFGQGQPLPPQPGYASAPYPPQQQMPYPGGVPVAAYAPGAYPPPQAQPQYGAQGGGYPPMYGGYPQGAGGIGTGTAPPMSQPFGYPRM